MFFVPRKYRVLLAGCASALAVLLHTFPAEAESAAGSLYPEPGTYELGKIQEVDSGWVLEDSVWWPHRFSSYVSGRITVFSFFYSTCTAVDGCPVAWAAFEEIHEVVKNDPELQGRVRLVFLSLDPKVDTPERLWFFAKSRQDSQEIAPWHFLTTWSESYLKPILDTMGQSPTRQLDDEGRPTSEINHMIKVYLIDEESWVREIYSSAFLDPKVVVNDIKTLLMEEEETASVPRTQ
ncbi:MAG: SCO family protein [Methyloligella sp. ZOD6]